MPTLLSTDEVNNIRDEVEGNLVTVSEENELMQLRQLIREKDIELGQLRQKIHAQGIYVDESTRFVVDKIVVHDERDMDMRNLGGFAHQLLEAAPVQIYVKNLSRQYVYLNAKSRLLLGGDVEDPIGKDDASLVTEADELQIFRQQDDYVINNCCKSQILEDWTPVHPDEEGKHRKIQTTRYPIVTADTGKVVGVASICEDRTYFAKQKLMNEIVTLINHDWIKGVLESLRVNLTSILRSASISPDRGISEKASYLLKLGKDDRYDASLIKKARPESGESPSDEILTLAFRQFIPVHFMSSYLLHMQWYQSIAEDAAVVSLARQSLNLKSQVVEYMQLFAASIGSEILTVTKDGTEVELRTSKDVFVYGDLDALRILVYQQLKNHEKHGDGRYPIRVCLDEEGNSAVLKFYSSGERIAEADRMDLGEPGKRIPKKDKYGYEIETEGSGVGLYYCRTVVEQLGGAWGIEWTEGFNVFVYEFRKVT